MDDNSKFAEQQCKKLKIHYVKIIKGKYYYFDNGKKTKIIKKLNCHIKKQTKDKNYFNMTSTYAVEDQVFYNNSYYKCVSCHKGHRLYDDTVVGEPPDNSKHWIKDI